MPRAAASTRANTLWFVFILLTLAGAGLAYSRPRWAPFRSRQSIPTSARCVPLCLREREREIVIQPIFLNLGQGFHTVPAPTAALDIADAAAPGHGVAGDGQRMVPVHVLDVAGLVPGAYQVCGLPSFVPSLPPRPSLSLPAYLAACLSVV